MSDHPSSQYLTHKYPIWQNCTLGEVVLLTVGILTASAIVLFFIGAALGQGTKVLLALIPVLFIGPKYGAKKLSEFKADKPHGYVMIRFKCLVASLLPGVVTVPYITRLGVWQRRASFKRGKSHV